MFPFDLVGWIVVESGFSIDGGLKMAAMGEPFPQSQGRAS